MVHLYKINRLMGYGLVMDPVFPVWYMIDFGFLLSEFDIFSYCQQVINVPVIFLY